LAHKLQDDAIVSFSFFAPPFALLSIARRLLALALKGNK
jgi:hypothetical protein